MAQLFHSRYKPRQFTLNSTAHPHQLTKKSRLYVFGVLCACFGSSSALAIYISILFGRVIQRSFDYLRLLHTVGGCLNIFSRCTSTRYYSPLRIDIHTPYLQTLPPFKPGSFLPSRGKPAGGYQTPTYNEPHFQCGRRVFRWMRDKHTFSIITYDELLSFSFDSRFVRKPRQLGVYRVVPVPDNLKNQRGRSLKISRADFRDE